MTELWLVRHGETEWSADGRHTSRTDVPLTEHGRETAAERGEVIWRGRSLLRCLRVRWQRARETCAIAGFGDVAVVDDGLREWDYGVYEGRTTKEIQAEIPGWSVWKDPIVGGETVEHVGERADGVIARALWRPNPHLRCEMWGTRLMRMGAGALFAHAHILRILAARWVGLEAQDGALFALGTGSVSVLGWEREDRVIQRWNRTFEM